MSFPSNSTRTKNWGTEILTDTDLEAAFDELHQYFIDSLDSSTGHNHEGGTNEGPQLDLTQAVTGVLPVANGGTGLATLAALMNLIYPIGSIYCNYSVSTNPATLLGVGTWVALAGSVLVGIDGTTEFLTAGQTGGSKTATITQAELPSYNLSFTRYDGNSSGFTGVQGTTNGANPTTQNVSSGGSGTAMPILPPYTVIYMWRRTA